MYNMGDAIARILIKILNSIPSLFFVQKNLDTFIVLLKYLSFYIAVVLWILSNTVKWYYYINYFYIF